MISSIVFMVMFRQAFSIGFWYWDITYPLELLLLLATVIILYQSPKQIMLVIALGVLLTPYLANRLAMGTVIGQQK